MWPGVDCQQVALAHAAGCAHLLQKHPLIGSSLGLYSLGLYA